MRQPEPTTTPIGALHALVLELFSAEEFRRWLRHGPYADVVPELPGEAAADATVVDAALGVLARRGWIDAEFFAEMTAVRDRKRDAIAAVAARWLRPPEAVRDAHTPHVIAGRVAERGMQEKGGASAGPPRGSVSADGIETGHGASWTASAATTSSSSPREVVLASWIHVSDLHFGHGAVGHQWNQRRVLGELLVDAEGLVKATVVPRPDFIFVTGDVAFSGGARAPATGDSEYQLAADWIGRLQLTLEIPQERVYLTPGNHDVDRTADADVRRMLRLARGGEETLDEILHDPRDLERLRGRMTRYLAFAQGFGPDAGDRLQGGLWWKSRVELAEGVVLRLCGLNTALLAADDEDQGKLRVGERQLAELFDPAPGEFELTLVLSHHPATGRWLADGKEVRGQLDRHSAIHLFGHLHEADAEQTKHGWGGGCLRIAAGAAHAEARTGDAPLLGHGYNFGALVLLASGDLAVRVWLRRWSTKAPHFVADVDNTHDRRDFAEHLLPKRYRLQRPAPRPGLHPDVVLVDRYRLVADVGQGGVGQVWRAIDLRTGEVVAVKVLNPDGAVPNPELSARFFEGARAMAQVRHGSIARVRDLRPDPGKGPYHFYVMDFIDAPNLAAASRGSPRSDAETIEILIAIAEALAPAHERGFIHRDLKPSNILRDPSSGQIFIVDYDTVKYLRNLTMARSATKLVDETYSAPEVRLSLRPSIVGAPPEIDRRADIFSLAVIGIALRTGSDPYFIAILPQMLADIECGPELKRVLMKGSAAAAADRYGTLDELVAALRRLQATDDPPTPTSRSPPFDGVKTTGGVDRRAPSPSISHPQPPPRAEVGGEENDGGHRGDGDSSGPAQASGSTLPRAPAVVARGPASPPKVWEQPLRQGAGEGNGASSGRDKEGARGPIDASLFGRCSSP